jgi:hypothetical protein
MGLMNRFLRGEGTRPSMAGANAAAPDERAYLSAAAVVHDYGVAVLSVSAAGRGCIADVCRLPHTKQRIKEALVLLLSVTEEVDLRERLKTSYLLLADWQEGVGQTIAPNPPSQGAGEASGAGAQDTQARDAAWQAWEQWRPRVLQEERALKAELQQLGFW